MKRPLVLSIAGFDPSSGAGITADLKVFEQLKVYGLGVTTAITYQTEDNFIGLKGLSQEEIDKQLSPLLEKYPVKFIKIGLIPSLEMASRTIQLIRSYQPKATIIWDPILRSSSGFQIHNSIDELKHLLQQVDLLTPNRPELAQILESTGIRSVEELSKYCAVLVKGGHSAGDEIQDVLYVEGLPLKGEVTKRVGADKHGTGCVLSAAICAYLALGENLEESCKRAKRYMQAFLKSDEGLLGYHND